MTFAASGLIQNDVVRGFMVVISVNSNFDL